MTAFKSGSAVIAFAAIAAAATALVAAQVAAANTWNAFSLRRVLRMGGAL